MAEPRYEDLSRGDRKRYAQALARARKFSKGSWAYRGHGSMVQALQVSLDSPEKMAYLLEKAPDRPSQQDINRCLVHAIQYGKVNAVEFLLSHGGDADAVDPPYGNTPLIHAAGIHQQWPIDRAAIVRLLLEHGAKVDVPRRDGYTPLHAAAYEGDPAVVALLLAAGADPDARTIGTRESRGTRAGQTPLQLAWDQRNTAQDKAGYLETMRLLQEAMKAKLERGR